MISNPYIFGRHPKIETESKEMMKKSPNIIAV